MLTAIHCLLYFQSHTYRPIILAETVITYHHSINSNNHRGME